MWGGSCERELKGAKTTTRLPVGTLRVSSVSNMTSTTVEAHAKVDDVEALISSVNNGDVLLGNTSSRTQLDIEQDYTDGDELPPLETYLSGWKFWCTFAVWPTVFLLLNAIVVCTVIVFDEYEFQYGRHHRFFRRSYEYYDNFNNPGMSQNVRLELMRYNRIVVTVLMLVDAFIAYRSVKYLEKSVREFDMIGEIDDVDGIQGRQPVDASASSRMSGVIKPSVHAQVSRRLDSFLGRGLLPRVSILVSFLWLLFVKCTAIGTVAFADMLFTFSPKAKQICASSSDTGMRYSDQESDDAFDSKKTNSTKKIINIPDELQDWARTRHEMYFAETGLVHLTNGTTFFSASNPSDDQEKGVMDYFGMKNQLVSIDSRGEIRFFPSVRSPRVFTSATGESALNSTDFCCLYMQRQSQSLYEFDFSFDTSILCIRSSDDIGSDVFPNVTVNKNAATTNMNKNFEGASLATYDNEVWVQKTFMDYSSRNGNAETSFEFYKIVPDATTLELKFVTKVAFSGYDFMENFEDPFLWGPGSPCYKWTKYIDLAVLLLVLLPASVWMIFLKNLSAGVVPACVAISFLLSRINNEFSIALCSMAAGAAFLALLGFLPIPLSREKLVWGLYTMLASIAGMIYSGRFYMFYDNMYNFERALLTIAIASLVGFILNHPVLYIFGWVGGIWAVFCGVFLLFTPERHEGLFAISLGIIMGSGCVTVGFNLIKYRAHLVFYSKRAWSAMNSAMQRSGASERSSQSGHAAARYTPVAAPAASAYPIPSPAPSRDEHDITTGLLNRSNEAGFHTN
jgi:hypothetical protein